MTLLQENDSVRTEGTLVLRVLRNNYDGLSFLIYNN